ncbi:MAG: MATE family efflux transporter [Nitrospirota bacterium]
MKRRNLLEGSIVKSLVFLAIPIVIGNLLHSAYHLTDLFWVGRLGEVAVAAMSMNFPVVFLFISLGIGLSTAGTILVAQYYGEKNHENVDFVAGQSVFMIALISILVSVLGYFLSPYIIGLMGAEEAVSMASTEYLQVSFIGMIFVFGYMNFQSLLRGVGEVKIPMFIILGSVLLNLIIDPIFILGYGPIPAFGVKGAAMATIITEGCAFAIGLFLLIRGWHGVRLKWKNLYPNFKFIKKLFALGFPTSIEMSTRSLAMIFMVFLVAGFGTTITAAYGIGGELMGLVILPALGLSMATSTMVGQNLGARNVERAEKASRKGVLIGFVILSVVGVLSFFFGETVSALFIPGEHSVIMESTKFIKIIAFSFGFIAIQQIFNGTFRGAGNTGTAMAISVVSLWGLQIPLAYILSTYTSLGAEGLWWAFPVTNVCAGVIAYIVFVRGKWKKTRITEGLIARTE